MTKKDLLVLLALLGLAIGLGTFVDRYGGKTPDGRENVSQRSLLAP